MNITDVCEFVLTVDTNETLTMYMGAALFIMSEVLAYMDIEANGILELITGTFLKSKEKQ